MDLNEIKLIFKQSLSVIQYLPDEEALKNQPLYLEFEKLIGKTLPINYKLTYKDKLYKTMQDNILVQEQYPPSINTASLYVEINETADGTYENPIPYDKNMELEEGLFYKQYDVIYKCIRSTGVAVFNALKDLINIYVIEVKE